MLSGFLEGSLHSWISAHSRLSTLPDDSGLSDSFKEVAFSILLSPEVLRTQMGIWAPSDEKSSSVLSRLFDHTGSKQNPEFLPSVLVALPTIFDAFISAVNKHRSTIYPQTAAGTGPERSVRVKAKRGCLDFLRACLERLDQLVSKDLGFWTCKVRLLLVLEKANLVQNDDVDSRSMLSALCEQAVGALGDEADGKTGS